MATPQVLYVAKDGQQTGPFSIAEIEAQLKSGKISTSDLAWHEGLTSWAPLESLEVFHSGEVPTAFPKTTTTAPYAGFWRRVAAHCIDALIFMAAGLFLGFFLVAFRAVGAANIETTLSRWLNLIGMIASCLYSAIMESSRRQGTVGKWLLGLRVTDLEGRRISFARALGRYFAKGLSLLTLGIGFMMAGWTKRKQALHDFIAKTLIVRETR